MVPLFAVIGWKAAVTLRLIWPVVYQKDSMVLLQPVAAMERLESAIKIWPSYKLLIEKGAWARAIANDTRIGGDDEVVWNEAPVDAYSTAFEMHPFNPEIAVNLGNSCAIAGSTNEATKYLEQAVKLQGGLETGFRARYYLASHLYQTWQNRWIKERRADEALGQFLRAQALLEEADPMIPWTLRNESEGLNKGIAESIDFLEGAGIKPAPAAD